MDFSRQNIESAFSTLYKGSEDEIKEANEFLMEWAQTSECPYMAYEIFTQSDNLQYENMALLILHRQIQNHWSLFNDSFQNIVRQHFFELLSDEPPSTEITNASISIIVLIAIHEWPEISPDYFDLVLNLDNNIYSFLIVAEFLNFLGDCNFVTRSRLASLRLAFIEHEYVQMVISLIQQTINQIQEQNQEINDQYTDIFLSILNSLFTWCDIQFFLTQDIIDYIISQIPNQKAYDCFHSLFINRTDSSELLIIILPNLIQSIIEEPNPTFLLHFLRKFGRMLEKTNIDYLEQLYSLLLEVEIEDDDLDDFWELWYVIIHRILFSSTSQEEENTLLTKIFSPFFDSMRNKFISLIPLAISNGKIVDFSAISTWELLNRIDKEGFLNFVTSLQTKFDYELDEKKQISIDLNYCASSLNFLIKTTQDQDLLDLFSDYFTKLLQEDYSMIDIQSTVFALSRSTILLSNNLELFEKYGDFILDFLESDILDLKETAANSFYFTLKEIPNFFATTVSDFSLFFLSSVDELLKSEIESDINDDSYMTMLFRCSILVASALTKESKGNEIDTSFFDSIADSILDILDDSAPIALKIITEIGNSSDEMCIYSFSKFWDPLFLLAKTNDKLINDYIIEALCAGIVNCPYEKVQQQIKIFVDLLLNEMEPEIAVSAISLCRENESSFDEYFPLFENLLNSPSVPLFKMYAAFSPQLIKFETAVPLICDGIIHIDINICNSAINCVKKFLNLIDEDLCTEFLINFRTQILHSLIQALIDFAHCSLVTRLSSALIKVVVTSRIFNIENIESELLSILNNLCEDENAENEFESFINLLVDSCDDKNKVDQIVADFLIKLKSVKLTDKIEILKRIDEIDDDEKKVIDEFDKSLEIKIDEK